MKVFMHSLVDFPTNEYLTFSVWVEYDDQLKTIITHTVQDMYFERKSTCLVDGFMSSGPIAYELIRKAGLSIQNPHLTTANPEEVLKDNVRKFRVAVRDALRWAEGLRKTATSKTNVMERNTHGGVA